MKTYIAYKKEINKVEYKFNLDINGEVKEFKAFPKLSTRIMFDVMDEEKQKDPVVISRTMDAVFGKELMEELVELDVDFEVLVEIMGDIMSEVNKDQSTPSQ